MTIEELIKQFEEIYEKTVSESSKIDNDIKKIVLNQIKSFSTQKGVIIDDEDNWLLVNDIISEVEKLFNKQLFTITMTTVLSDYDKIQKNIVEIQKLVNDVDVKKFLKDNLSPLQSSYVQMVETRLSNTVTFAKVVTPVNEVLSEMILVGTPLSDAEEKFTKKFFIQNPDVPEDLRGAYERYFGQVMRDAYFGYDGAVQAELANKYGFDAYLYVGNIQDNTRAKCAEWVRRKKLSFEFLEKDLQESWSGKMPNTNLENFPIHRGGYGCKHRAISTFKE